MLSPDEQAQIIARAPNHTHPRYHVFDWELRALRVCVHSRNFIIRLAMTCCINPQKMKANSRDMKKLLITLTAGLIAVTAQAQYNKVYHGGGFYHGGRWHSTHHGGGHWRQGVHIREPQQPVQQP